MSRSQVKIAIAIASVLMMACVCCGGLALMGIWSIDRAMVTDPTQAAQLGSEIADYTLPVGYSEMFGMRLMGMDMLAIAPNPPQPDGMVIFLIKVPESDSIDQETLQKQIEGALQQQSSFQSLKLTLDDVETRTVNGQEVTLTYRKGEDGAGTPYRQVSALFSVENGRVLLLAQGSAAEWDQQALDVLLDSIH